MPKTFKHLRKINVFCLWGSIPRLQGVLARPGTQSDPMSDIFFTKWVAIPPFWTSEAGFCTEFRCGSSQIGLAPLISTFLKPFFDQKSKKVVSWQEKSAPARQASCRHESFFSQGRFQILSSAEKGASGAAAGVSAAPSQKCPCGPKDAPAAFCAPLMGPTGPPQGPQTPCWGQRAPTHVLGPMGPI